MHELAEVAGPGPDEESGPGPAEESGPEIWEGFSKIVTFLPVWDALWKVFRNRVNHG